MTENQSKLIEMLKEMFQFDQADLDFGIYRIMNLKRNEIQNYLENTLPEQINNLLAELKSIENEEKLKEYKKQIEETNNGPLSLKIKQQIVAEYEEKIKELNNIDISNVESEIYSHLISFFSRYYDDGDFISQRRYKDGTYALPYEGEEVKLYWANIDQYFTKNTEYFNNYSFKSAYGKNVVFKTIEAESEKDNNINDEKKYFVISKDKPYEIKDDQLIVCFEYRESQSGKQEEENRNTIEILKSHLEDQIDYLSLFKAPNSKEKSEIEKQLFKYTTKNTRDYFIHKDLKTFLNRELDFYIKNEILYVDDIQQTDLAKVKEYLIKAKTVTEVAKKIIEFLSQIENFQKELYLKKKFVIDTQYCITIDRIPESMYQKIIENKEQIKEWIKLFSINEIQESDGTLFDEKVLGYTDPLTIEFLKQNKYLVLDTKFFSSEFKEELVESIESFDENNEGLLVQADNFQMLNLLQERYRESINCIYVDPPYNTDSSPIMYKNNYRDSSWNSLIYDRLLIAKKYLKETGLIIQAIDDTEYRYLINISDMVFGKENYISTITSSCNPQGRVANNVNKVSEYHILHAKNIDTLDEISVEKFENKTSMTQFKRTGTNSRRTQRPKRFYPMLVKNGKVYTITKDEYSKIYNKNQNTFNDDYVNELKNKYETEGYEFILPKMDDGTFLVWQREYPRAVKECETYIYKDGTIYTPGFDRETPKTLWNSPLYANPEYGTEKLKNMMQNIVEHDLSKNTAKSIHTLSQFVDINTNDVVLDYFAGSGTTGHAVVNYNRTNDDNKKFILCEMGEYFDTVTKPRIEKCIYTDSWKDCKPQDNKGVSQQFKYIRLESYEDTLNNISFEKHPENLSSIIEEEYMLKYMLNNETKKSVFNVDKLAHPFDYEMTIIVNQESKTKKVDLVETFNYLIGLVVDRNYARKSYDASFISEESGITKAKIYKGTNYTFKLIKGHSLSGEKILVIWRDMTDDTLKDNAVLDAFLEENSINPNSGSYDKLYINCDNNVQNLNGTKVVLIEEELQKRMFDY